MLMAPTWADRITVLRADEKRLRALVKSKRAEAKAARKERRWLDAHKATVDARMFDDMRIRATGDLARIKRDRLLDITGG